MSIAKKGGKIMKLSTLSENELREVSLLKNKKGCATSNALEAQRILYERHHWGGGTRPENVPYGANETEW